MGMFSIRGVENEPASGRKDNKKTRFDENQKRRIGIRM